MPRTDTRMDGRNRRRLLGWTGGLAAALLGAVAIATPIARSIGGDRAVISTQFGEFTAPQETMKALQWLSERERTNGFRCNAARELTHARLMLEPAAGVQLPSGEFEAKSVRFNEAGEVVHIEYADANAPGCTIVWVQDTSNPRYWYATCTGSCPVSGDPCALFLDLGTLALACGCLP